MASDSIKRRSFEIENGTASSTRYNRGLIAENVCYQELSAQFAMGVPDITHAVSPMKSRRSENE